MRFTTPLALSAVLIWRNLCRQADRAITLRPTSSIHVGLFCVAVLSVVACGGRAEHVGGSSAPPAEAGAPSSAGASGAAGSTAGAAGETGGGGSPPAEAGGPSGVGTPGAAGATAGAAECSYDGVAYEVGESFKCDCNECKCEAGGFLSSTAVECLPCLYAGKEVLSGATIPDRDGCNSCTCEFAAISCTKKACTCDPAKEWWRNYVATSAKECSLVDFTCDAGATPFSNDCGCGCEEPSTCPQFAQCDPAYDCAKILADCPYAGAAN